MMPRRFLQARTRASAAEGDWRRRLGWVGMVLWFAGCSSCDNHVGSIESDVGVSDGATKKDAGHSSEKDAGGGADGSVFSNDAGHQAADGGCGLRTCASAQAECGLIGDGCGGVVSCGTCAPPKTCGGGGTPSKCGGTGGCVPRTCAQAGAECGPIGDGCGGQLECGTCILPAKCGGGGASRCGNLGPVTDAGTAGCVPRTCAQVGATCGPAGDGCGGQIECGECRAPTTCGGGGIPSACGGGCVSRTCAGAGANCGPVADGCGGALECGSCARPDICGGGGTPSVCGSTSQPDGGHPCENLCKQQVSCTGGKTTSVSGTVFAPNGVEPIVGALVYVPNGTVEAFTPGVACLKCDAQVSGSPLVSATTAADGTFRITNMPVGDGIPLVIQLGRWRRQVRIPKVTACTDTALSSSLSHLPRTRGEGDIPLTAIATGDVDALECVLRKVGIADSEFTNPPGNGKGSGVGRIHIFQQNGAIIDDDTPAAGDALWGATPTLDNYDMVIFSCEGDQYDKPSDAKEQVLKYANKGGRVFATHYSYVWLYDNEPWGCGDGCTTAGKTTAAWNLEQPGGDSIKALLDTSFPKGASFSEWLDNLGTSSITIQDWRHDVDSVYAPAQRWVYTSTGRQSTIQHFTFNTPVGAGSSAQCGRVVFSDFHVADVRSEGKKFPKECKGSTLSTQERLLEFMLFDLASCITPDKPATCTPKTCAQMGASCGPAGDGCGGILQCGSCTQPDTCGGGGIPSACGHSTCTRRTCAQQSIECGPAGDGCGGILQCGVCKGSEVCGGGGPGKCGTVACVPKTCAQLGIACGPAGDGCGNLLQCGTCAAPATCGGGGTLFVCGTPSCTRTTCEAMKAQCGPIADGCGGILDCGTCSPPRKCGGGGVPNVCESEVN